MRNLLLSFFVLLVSVAQSQELERVPMYLSRARFDNTNTGQRDLLTLPFFDDFAEHRAGRTNPNVLFWKDNDVYVNNVMPLDPLTIGVATFDGLDAKGYPYDFSDQYAQGPADTLTSQGIDLAGLDSTDNVYLSFYFQAGGWGNMPDEEDSLFVDFYSPLTGAWEKKWVVTSPNNTSWSRADLHIAQTQFLQAGFQFRFRNEATLSGAYDQWNIDYVLLREGLDTSNIAFDEVGMQYVPSLPFSNGYSTMPWKHFKGNPAGFLNPTLTAFERNLGNAENIATGYRIKCNGQVQQASAVVLNTFANENQSLEESMNWNTAILQNPLLSDTTVNVEVCTFINPTDAHLENDTACYSIEMSNYYAYDDGSAERSWTVQGSGSQVALKFYNYAADTLMGLAVNWLPYGIDHSVQTFFLKVWSDNAGVPGSLISENFNYQYPQYTDSVGYDSFTFHELDNPIVLGVGTYYVGWVQSDAPTYDVGNDKNTNNNPAKLFYSLGVDQPWQASQVTGSVMIRPVLRSGKQQIWNGIDGGDSNQDWGLVYPNPALDCVHFDAPGSCVFEVFDVTGQLVQKGSSLNSHIVIDVNAWSQGLYFIKALSQGQQHVFRFSK